MTLSDSSGRDFGPQPLVEVMARLGITNDALVGASTDQLTFKMVTKGCKGRKLTPNAQYKIPPEGSLIGRRTARAPPGRKINS
ncbi:MAG: hypothetical protein IT395_05440 [Candidatus Omnitrophica bacterium]|nr:hypothetical protein [Candidatus Omnitrophota bacterium]